ncbi:MAG: NADH-quinone oxidoreductase subunit H [Ignavibacteriales bacterium]|jgi:NADH-quinone oxidoreductase subunit H|nr:NADH-quinone oxidoreductase subunit H [Ignavibacteriales bacterium]MBP7543217.1 NADH-quinone oxidoreductase subunit H [Ignavibacteriaceae bacterium]MBK7267037.1 NADH-quinone oxidoreductase subunit H [Ignavibacteriales bacterium]MBK8660801.1 NADH-quinone oxidoreductase subunit H [Ignavibacteriales bacterium]MBP9123442.1 NADH-quinone oxidoreductase subunit H [Ignavibacteriaceae bacterium]
MTTIFNVWDFLLILLYAIIPLAYIIPFALMAVYAERKISAWIQNRVGPNRTGPIGLFQTTADILKLMQKEDIVANGADKKLFLLAPIVVFIGSYAAYAALPFTSVYIGTNINLGVLYMVAISGFVVAGIIFAGWASDNKYSIMGSLRSAAQLVSYEIPTLFVIISIFAITQQFNLRELSEMQTSNILNWGIFGFDGLGYKRILLIPVLFVLMIILFISTLAEVNRTPFDLPEAESELVAGFHTEYSGMKFALFFLSEYANMFAVSGLVTAFFLGGYQSPFGYLGNLLGLSWLVPIEQVLWFLTKGILLVCVQIWMRWSLPRLRMDQLMRVCWKYLIPIGFVCFIYITIVMYL